LAFSAFLLDSDNDLLRAPLFGGSVKFSRDRIRIGASQLQLNLIKYFPGSRSTAPAFKSAARTTRPRIPFRRGR
jgi:hypothetical protein